VVKTYIAVLSPRGVALALWIDGDVIQGAEVAFYSTHLILENFVVESRLELALPRVRRCHVNGRLAASENDIIFDWGDASAVEGRVGGIALQFSKLLGGYELG
jgi:hypothetical protein